MKRNDFNILKLFRQFLVELDTYLEIKLNKKFMKYTLEEMLEMDEIEENLEMDEIEENLEMDENEENLEMDEIDELMEDKVKVNEFLKRRRY